MNYYLKSKFYNIWLNKNSTNFAHAFNTIASLTHSLFYWSVLCQARKASGNVLCVLGVSVMHHSTSCRLYF